MLGLMLGCMLAIMLEHMLGHMLGINARKATRTVPEEVVGKFEIR